MNQDNNDELQKAINEVTQKAAANNAEAAATPNISTPDKPADTQTPIVEPRSMAGSDKQDDAVAAAMVSVLPNSTPAPEPAAPAPVTDPAAGAANLGVTPPADIQSPAPNNAPSDPNLAQAKEQALRELAPLLANTNIEPEKKYKVYRDMVETLHDNSVLMPAVDAAKQITDEGARAEALLEIVDLIDETEKK